RARGLPRRTHRADEPADRWLVHRGAPSQHLERGDAAGHLEQRRLRQRLAVRREEAARPERLGAGRPGHVPHDAHRPGGGRGDWGALRMAAVTATPTRRRPVVLLLILLVTSGLVLAPLRPCAPGGTPSESRRAGGTGTPGPP